MLIGLSAKASVERASPRGGSDLVAQTTPNYVTWYTAGPSTPTPIPGAYVSIAEALGAGNIYNLNGASGIALLNNCEFLCYGAPGIASSNAFAVGNDVGADTFTTLGAPDDCSTTTAPLCPGGISDKAFSIEGYSSPTATPTVLIAIDQNGNFASSNGMYAGGAVIAGAGTGGVAPSPSPGSLVSNMTSTTGPTTGDVLLGGASDYAKCDYQETLGSTITCNKALVVAVGTSSGGINSSGTVWATGGVQPNSTSVGGSGGYAPEAFPLGVAAQHPQILTGSCSVTGTSALCVFANGFTFGSTSYNCAISAQGTSATANSYVKTSATSITIYSGAAATFSYTCMQ